MKITHALLGEHGAIYPLLDFIEKTALDARLEQTKLQAALLQSTLITHASIEDAVLRPAIEKHLARSHNTGGQPVPTDHEIIRTALNDVLATADGKQARRLLLDTIVTTRKHFEKEEKTIFVMAERELTEREQERLGAEWAARRGVFLG